VGGLGEKTYMRGVLERKIGYEGLTQTNSERKEKLASVVEGEGLRRSAGLSGGKRHTTKKSPMTMESIEGLSLTVFP